MDFYATVVGFFQEGGFFMYPIMLVLAAGLAIAVERYLYLSAARMSNMKVWDRILPILQAGKYREAVTEVAKSKSAVARILLYGLTTRMGAGRRTTDIESAMEEGMLEIVPRLEKRTGYIATFANISTLLGLLGTILGLIAAFTAVSNADPAEKANLLSSSISVAMNTTAFGLIAAIPLLLIHSVLQTKTNQIVDSLEMASVKFLNVIRQANQRELAEMAQAAEDIG